MSVTRSDLYVIAGALQISMPHPDELTEAAYPNVKKQWKRDVVVIADALADSMGLNGNGNRRFNYERFYRACGMIEEKM